MCLKYKLKYNIDNIENTNKDMCGSSSEFVNVNSYLCVDIYISVSLVSAN